MLFHDLQRNKLPLQQPRRPARMSRRRLRTGQRNQPRFPVQSPRLAVHLIAPLKRSPDPFQHALLARTLHRRPTLAENRCDIRIRQPPSPPRSSSARRRMCACRRLCAAASPRTSAARSVRSSSERDTRCCFPAIPFHNLPPTTCLACHDKAAPSDSLLVVACSHRHIATGTLCKCEAVEIPARNVLQIKRGRILEVRNAETQDSP